jgi:ribonucleoside-diphosphate reductase alpha chain
MDNNINFLNEISNFTFTSKYARFNEVYSRRETWEECVGRVEKMHLDRFKKLPKEDLDTIKWAFDVVKEKLAVPSMRSMQFGGKAILAHNARMYNCSVRHIDSIRSFSECFYLLLCGCGVGFGITNHFLDRLPNLVDAKDKNGTVISYIVEDSIEGWADSIEVLLLCYFKNTAFTGRKIVFDYSKIRKEGEKLKTSGGKAPGYKGLKLCHQKVKQLLDHVIEDKKQYRLKTINAYDILMHCSDAVLSGGIRRAACSVVFSKDDADMMNSKTYFVVSKHTKIWHDEDDDKYHSKVTIDGKKYDVAISKWESEQLEKENKIGWLHIEPQRARSNNSVLLLRGETSAEEFREVVERTKQFGEPGFVWADHPHQLFNPCFEIGFIPVTDDGQCGVQFCNLTSLNGAKINSEELFFKAVKAASIIGTLQAAYTNKLGYLSHVCKTLTEDEALLGVSVTGMMDNPHVLLNEDLQRKGAQLVVETNKEWAKKLGINPCARATCVKPEGTTSLVLESGSGIHPHHARRYFRRIQCNKLDPIYKFAKSINPHMCQESVWSANKTDDVIVFPITVPDNAMIKSDLSAIEHLVHIKNTQTNWVIVGSDIESNKKKITHNVSCTVVVKDEEWSSVIDYIYENRACFSAVSLLPYIGDKLYKQAPMEAVVTPEDEVLWNTLVSQYKHVDYKKLHEDEDETTLTQNLACSGGKCELL